MSTLYSVLYDSGSGRGMAPSESEVYHTRARTGEEAIKKVLKHQGNKELPTSREFDHNLVGRGAFLYYDGESWTASPVEEI